MNKKDVAREAAETLFRIGETGSNRLKRALEGKTVTKLANQLAKLSPEEQVKHLHDNYEIEAAYLTSVGRLHIGNELPSAPRREKANRIKMGQLGLLSGQPTEIKNA